MVGDVVQVRVSFQLVINDPHSTLSSSLSGGTLLLPLFSVPRTTGDCPGRVWKSSSAGPLAGGLQSHNPHSSPATTAGAQVDGNAVVSVVRRGVIVDSCVCAPTPDGALLCRATAHDPGEMGIRVESVDGCKQIWTCVVQEASAKPRAAKALRGPKKRRPEPRNCSKAVPKDVR